VSASRAGDDDESAVKPAPGEPAVVAGSELFRESLALLLRERRRLEITTASIREAASVSRAVTARFVVLELGPHEEGELAAVPGLLRLRPAPRLVAVCNHCAPERVSAILDAGACACITAAEGVEQLDEALEAAREGRRHLSPRIADALAGPSLVERSSAAVVLGSNVLTARERQVLRLIVQGMTGRQIAGDLGLSPKTVHTHRMHIMNKLHVHTAVALLRRAVQLGLVEL